MSVTRYAGDKFTALTGDSFPTGVKDGATLYTLDSFEIYIKQGGGWNLVVGSGGGESNTASNSIIGSGLYSGKVGVDLKFKGLTTDSFLNITGDESHLQFNVDTSKVVTANQTNLRHELYISSDNTGFLGFYEANGIDDYAMYLGYKDAAPLTPVFYANGNDDVPCIDFYRRQLSGDWRISGQTFVTGGPYYPLNTNPSGYSTTPRKIHQFVWAGQTGSLVTNALIPADTSIPQSGEGATFASLQITPSGIGNKIFLACESVIGSSNNIQVIFAFFESGVGADALAASLVGSTASNLYMKKSALGYEYTVTGLAPVTFLWKAGTSNATYNATVNQFNTTTYFNGVCTAPFYAIEYS